MMGTTFTYSSIALVLETLMELNPGETVSFYVPPENSLENIENMLELNLPKNSFIVSLNYSESSVKIRKLNTGGSMKTVSSIETIRDCMKGCDRDQTFIVAEELDAVRSLELIGKLEQSGDLTVSQYDLNSIPRTLTILCRL